MFFQSLLIRYQAIFISCSSTFRFSLKWSDFFVYKSEIRPIKCLLFFQYLPNPFIKYYLNKKLSLQFLTKATIRVSHSVQILVLSERLTLICQKYRLVLSNPKAATSHTHGHPLVSRYIYFFTTLTDHSKYV